MNIFALDYDAKKAAKYHVDTHVSKMTLETAQLLSTFVNTESGKQVSPYKTTHANNPCVNWIRESKGNFLWLCELGIELGNEFEYRRGKSHKSVEVTKLCLSMQDVFEWNKVALTPFTQVVDECYKHQDPVQAYRRYYARAKQHLHKWTKRNRPQWM